MHVLVSNMPQVRHCLHVMHAAIIPNVLNDGGGGKARRRRRVAAAEDPHARPESLVACLWYRVLQEARLTAIAELKHPQECPSNARRFMFQKEFKLRRILSETKSATIYF